MAAPVTLRATSSVKAGRIAQPALPVLPHAGGRPLLASRPHQSTALKGRLQHIVRAAETDTTVDVDAIVKDLQAKWDGVENKTSVLVYAGGAVVLLWLSSSIVSAVNALPLIPKLLELVGLGYTAWFVYRYLLFKSSREELIKDIDELKKKISGVADEAAGKAKA